MKIKTLYLSWAVLYALTCGLAFIPNPTGVWSALLTAVSLAFFLPPAWLLYRAIGEKRWNTVRLLRVLSITSLALTLLVLVLTFLAAAGRAEAALGQLLQVLLILVSAPMVCSQVWVLSLFCWACILMITLKYRKEK
jgi:cytochrome bd-type quinol oxidase subunit 2